MVLLEIKLRTSVQQIGLLRKATWQWLLGGFTFQLEYFEASFIFNEIEELCKRLVMDFQHVLSNANVAVDSTAKIGVDKRLIVSRSVSTLSCYVFCFFFLIGIHLQYCLSLLCFFF